VFVVGCLGDGNAAAKVLFERESVCRDTPPRRETGQGTAADAEKCFAGGSESDIAAALETTCHDYSRADGFNTIIKPVVTDRAASHWEGSGIHPTLNQSSSHGAIGYSNQEIFSQGGAGLVQAIPIHDQATRNAGKRGDRQDGKGNGLGVGKPGDPAPTLTKGDKHAVLFQKSELRLTDKITLKEVCPTLKAGTKAGDSEPLALVQAVDVYNQTIDGDVAATLTKAVGGTNTSGAKVMAFKPGQSAKARSLGAQVEIACTLEGGGGGNNKVAVAFEPGIAKREGNASRFVEEMSPTLRKDMGDNQVAVAVVAPTLTAHNDPSRSPQSSEVTQQVASVHSASMAVRRLTPRECERLQGFPDDWTLIPWRGKPADQCPDGPRYKALGNSMAVPCMAWIGKRIADAEASK
jgi:site-specific DNA-cytosine methylase